MAVGDLAGIKAKHIVLDTLDESLAPDNSIFISQSTGELKNKLGATTPNVIGATSSDSLFLKSKQNGLGVDIPPNTPVSLKPDGTIVPSDSDGALTQIFIGFTRENIAAGQFGMVGLISPNYTGTVAGKGFTSGEEIFMGETSGQMINEAGLLLFTGNNDSILRVGVADCATLTASGVATDLISFSGILSRP